MSPTPGKISLRIPRRLTPASLLVALIVTAVLVAVTLISRSRPAVSPEQPEGSVTRVYDGDTVAVSGIGKVRLIGVDALDSHNEEKVLKQSRSLGLSEDAVKQWSERATRRAKELLDGRRVRLEFGPERRDDYGRTLAYVFVRSDGQEVLFNRLLLQEGLATAYGSYRHPRLEEFLDLESSARAGRAGFWKEATTPR